MREYTHPGIAARRSAITEWTWALALWCFRIFCLVWLVIVAMVGGRAVLSFLHR